MAPNPTMLLPFALVLAPFVPQGTSEAPLAAPLRVLADGAPIDVSYGHATPLFVDWDGDGLRDLLVGQYAGGRLRVYRNEGTPTAPRFGSFHWFETEAGRASVPIS